MGRQDTVVPQAPMITHSHMSIRKQEEAAAASPQGRQSLGGPIAFVIKDPSYTQIYPLLTYIQCMKFQNDTCRNMLRGNNHG